MFRRALLGVAVVAIIGVSSPSAEARYGRGFRGGGFYSSGFRSPVRRSYYGGRGFYSGRRSSFYGGRGYYSRGFYGGGFSRGFYY